MSNKVQARHHVRRVKARAQYDRADVYAILDAGMLAHVAFCVDGQPYVIPMMYAREHDTLLLHGSVASRLLRELVRLTKFPITSTLMGLGAYPASDPQWLGMLGLHGTYEANWAMHSAAAALRRERFRIAIEKTKRWQVGKRERDGPGDEASGARQIGCFPARGLPQSGSKGLSQSRRPWRAQHP